MKRFRLLLIAAMLVIGGASASAVRQSVSEIKGTVLDKATGEPLGWTTVALMRPDSTLAAGATCDDKGIYSLQAAPGEYIIKASLIGYKDIFKNVRIISGLNGELGTDDGGMYFGDTDRFLLRENVNGNLSYRTAKTNTFVSAYQGIYDMDIDMDIDNKLMQNGVPFRILAQSLQKDRYHNWQVRFGNDWFINKRNTLGFIVNLPGSRNVMKSDRDHNVTTQTLGDHEFERTESATLNKDKSRQTNGNVNFTHIFNEATNSEVTLNLDDVLRSSCTNLDCMGLSSTVLGDVSSMYVGQKYYAQVAHIGLSWRFGKAQQTRARKVGNIDEASRIGGGKGLNGK